MYFQNRRCVSIIKNFIRQIALVFLTYQDIDTITLPYLFVIDIQQQFPFPLYFCVSQIMFFRLH